MRFQYFGVEAVIPLCLYRTVLNYTHSTSNTSFKITLNYFYCMFRPVIDHHQVDVQSYIYLMMTDNRPKYAAEL
jgi:hypothetical protein